ncbi:MAG: beta-glucosidase [Sphingobacteriales bacterium]|nr:beta-glucosidase [Sphingobacteriales bacterium]
MIKIFFATVILLSCNPGKHYGSSAADMSAVDSVIFTEVQRQTFQYFRHGAEPVSGMARERFHADGNYHTFQNKNIITSGGSGFGVMAWLVAIERNFVTKEEGRSGLEKIVNFLETADRFHGAWPHWWQGETGRVSPFSPDDDGGDLVETSFLIQGLLCVRQYFNTGNEKERTLAARIDKLWKEVEFDWYRNKQNVLYWHWSPVHQWKMNFPVRGYNECLIMYVLAASSPTHGVPAEVYHEGWAENARPDDPVGRGKINDVNKPDGIAADYPYKLQMKHQGDAWNGGPLFWAHYSYLGLDPRGLKDKYADYWKECKNQALINYQWCVDNPKKFKGYGPANWGLTSSYSVKGYDGHAPTMERDIGVISPTAALSSFPYTPQQSMAAMKYWYNNKKDKLWGPYGFYDAFSEEHNWYLPHYLAIDQGPIVVMMENYRSGLLWKLFMSCPEIKEGLIKLGFSSPHLK